MQRVEAKIILAAVAFCILVLPAQAEPIKVGAIFAMTGGASVLGGPEARSARMVVEEINNAGGINGNTIELIVKDSGTDPEKAVSFARQLIEKEKVLAIIGPSTSGESMKIKKIAEKGKTTLLTCGAAEVIVNPVASYVFKTPQKDSFAVKKIYAEMKKKGISKIAVVAGNTGFGKAGMAQLMKIAHEFGIEVLVAEIYNDKATDLSALVAKLMFNKDIQAVVNWSIVPAQAIIAKNIRQAGWQVPLFQSHGFGNIKYVEAAGSAAEGIIFPSGRLLVADALPDSDPQKQLLMKYKKDYESRYKEAASIFGGHGYDAMIILAEAIKIAGNDRAKVRYVIENLKNFPGTGGVFSFSGEDHNGLDINSFVMLTVKDGKFVFYKDGE